MEVKEENVLAAYDIAREAGADSTMKVLEALFGEERFRQKNIIERVKTFGDAVRELGATHPLVRAYNNMRTVVDKNSLAYIKLRIIVAALNEGWTPPQDCETNVWYCWHWLYTKNELDTMSDNEKALKHMLDITGKYHGPSCGFGFAGSHTAPSCTYVNIGSRFCFKTQELAEYCGKQFIDLWADLRLI